MLRLHAKPRHASDTLVESNANASRYPRHDRSDCRPGRAARTARTMRGTRFSRRGIVTGGKRRLRDRNEPNQRRSTNAPTRNGALTFAYFLVIHPEVVLFVARVHPDAVLLFCDHTVLACLELVLANDRCFLWAATMFAGLRADAKDRTTKTTSGDGRPFLGHVPWPVNPDATCLLEGAGRRRSRRYKAHKGPSASRKAGPAERDPSHPQRRCQASRRTMLLFNENVTPNCSIRMSRMTAWKTFTMRRKEVPRAGLLVSAVTGRPRCAVTWLRGGPEGSAGSAMR